MAQEHLTPTNETDPQIATALDELRQLIRARYPDAAFTVFRGEDPDGIYLRVTVDLDDTDEVVDHVLDKLYEVQVERELPVYIVTVPPLERVAALLRDTKRRYTPPISQRPLPL